MSIYDKLAQKLNDVGYTPRQATASAQAGSQRAEGKSLIDKAVHKVIANTGYRADMQLIDAAPVEKNAVAVLFSYSPELGDLTKADVAAYFDRHFPNTPVEVVAETAQFYPKSRTISVIVKRIVPTRPLADASGMTKVTASTFLDTTIGEIWEVCERDGQKFLTKVVEDDIVKPTIEKAARITSPVRAKVSLASVKVEAGLTVSKGDTVRFYADNGTHTGTVVSVGEKIRVKTSDGKMYSLAPDAIFYRSRLGEKTRKEIADDAYDYYEKVYGPEYAKELTKI